MSVGSSNIKNMNLLCPKCKSASGMQKIQNGLPDGPPDDSEVVLGGCCIEENDPEDVCITCGWRGTGKKEQFLLVEGKWKLN